MRQYKRDKRSPVPSSLTASKVMGSIKAKDTKPELTLRRALWKEGIRGYRLHHPVPGRPDVVFPVKKVAIFVHGCFWHRCPKCDLPLPTSNQEFWKEKFKKNIERDKKKEAALNGLGWQVLTFWECDIKGDVETVIRKIRKNIE